MTAMVATNVHDLHPHYCGMLVSLAHPDPRREDRIVGVLTGYGFTASGAVVTVSVFGKEVQQHLGHHATVTLFDHTEDGE